MSSNPPKQKGRGTRKRNGKAAGSNEEGGDGSQRTNASWSDSLVKTLLLVCRDFQKISEGEQQFKWPDITSAFQKASGMQYNQDSVKNKFDQQKRIWNDWSDLRYKETGCGWDYRTGRVTAPDEWWTNKLKESDKYKRFRKAGVDPATSELWDQVFGFTTATGKNVDSPSMDPSVRATLAIMPGHPSEANLLNEPGNEMASLIENDQRLIEEGNQETLDSIQLDPSVDQEFLEQVHQIVTGVGPSSCPLPRRPAASKSLCSSLESTRVKKKSRSSPYMERFDRLEARGEKFLELFQEEINSSSVKGDTPRTNYEQHDAMIALKALITEGMVEEGSDIWCFAHSEFRKPESCVAFLTAEKNEMRLKWLTYEFKIHNKVMGFN